jgi:hypothetical protein
MDISKLNEAEQKFVKSHVESLCKEILRKREMFKSYLDECDSDPTLEEVAKATIYWSIRDIAKNLSDFGFSEDAFDLLRIRANVDIPGMLFILDKFLRRLINDYSQNWTDVDNEELAKFNWKSLKDQRAWIIRQCVYTEDGHHMFGDEDLEKIKEIPPHVLAPLFSTCMRLSNFPWIKQQANNSQAESAEHETDKSLWEDVSPDMQEAIQEFWKESEALKSKHKRLSIEKFCRKKGIDESTFENEKHKAEQLPDKQQNSFLPFQLEAVQAGTKRTGRMAETSADEYKAQIATRLHPYIKFLRGRWQEFCEMVERNAEKLAYYQKKYIGPKERLIEKHKKYEQAISANDTKKIIERHKTELAQIQFRMDEEKRKQQKKGWATWRFQSAEYLNLPVLLGDFCAPLDVVNPVSWILDGWNPRPSKPEESLLCDHAILCYVHDHNISSGEQSIYMPRTYKGRYFACDKFYYLDRHVWPKERLQRAFDTVKAELDRLQEQEKPCETAVQTGPSEIISQQTGEYRQFLERSCDEIADLIAENPELKDLIAKDLNKREDDLKKFNAEWDAENKRFIAWRESPKGRKVMDTYNAKVEAYITKRLEFQERLSEWEHADYLHKKEPGKYKHPGPKPQEPKSESPKPPRESVGKELKRPLAKFNFPIRHETFTIKDNRIFLGALHDGFLWDQIDIGLLICPHLAKPGTIVDFLYWGRISKDSRYRRSIKRALQEVKTDLKKSQKKAGQGKNWHNDDFTEVRWNGRRYKFDKQQQALSVGYLWNNKRAREKSIGEAIGSEADNFRLIHIFRQSGKKAKMHPAWGTMIIADGKGIYALAESIKAPKK